ncbi:hypothetical protein GCM10022243_00030 [Saccharothrix violaceirubra]|uniref:Uncharacterized protein n=1 Tax=Saccharothrix violaceirubra TaxID=413306 RepID=A0A7W7WVN1_9PSEU|nr:hypothetical protein [Saccharothrix violaceirubra]MBB4965495.1 hypothetical protein [Saccharothrix violaceirubra]
MTALLPVSGPGTEQDTVVYVVVFPEGLLVVRHAASGCEPLDDEDVPPYQAGLWSAVADDVDPDRHEVNGIALDGDLRAKLADAADTTPAEYSDNPVATRMPLALGAEPQPRRGAVAIVAEEDPQTGLTGSLSAGQLALIVQTHQTALLPATGRSRRKQIAREVPAVDR